MAVSVFDLFKIGIGPSSSHTVGPMRAARSFALRLQADGQLAATRGLRVELYGSLGATGRGHGSDKAVLLGLAGHEPDSVDVEAVPRLLLEMRDARSVPLLGSQPVPFNEKTDLVFNRRESLPLHPNGMRFVALDAGGAPLVEHIYYSVGGGFVVAGDEAGEKRIVEDQTPLPLPFLTGEELLQICAREKLSIAGVMRRNERAWRDDATIDAGLLRIWQVMQQCVKRGCSTPGTLPGGYKVKRRAPGLFAQLIGNPRRRCATS